MAREPWLPGKADEEPGRVARPYTVTGGRTRPRTDQEVEFETLVWVAGLAVSSPMAMSAHWRQVVELCRQVVSLAEVAARLGLPIGVARVLVCDMAEAGLLRLQRPAHAGEGAKVALLERVLYGLRQL
jgi:Protein of unknown function (DUF742)